MNAKGFHLLNSILLETLLHSLLKMKQTKQFFHTAKKNVQEPTRK